MSAHVLDRLSLYLDGELAAAARTEVEAHLRGCPACARHLEELAAVDAAARELPVPAPAGYFDSLPARVRARLPASRRRAPPVWVWAAAAGLALAALAPLMLRQTASPVPEAARTDETARVAAPPPAPAAPAPAAPAPAEAPRAGGERVKTLAAPKDAARSKPAPTPVPLLYEPGRENAAAARPSPSGQIQKHTGPFAQAPAAAARAEEMRADEAPAETAPEKKLERDQARRGGLADATITAAQTSDETTRFRTLVAQRPASTGQARQLHDAWTAFAAAYPSSPRADEARVRAIEALALAWDKGGDPADQEGARQAALDYLAAPRAPQRTRVRALLDRLGSPRP